MSRLQNRQMPCTITLARVLFSVPLLLHVMGKREENCVSDWTNSIEANPIAFFQEIEWALFYEDLICRMSKMQTHMRSPRSIYLPNARHTPQGGTHLRSCIGTLVNWPVLIKVGFWRYFLSGNSERLRLFFCILWKVRRSPGRTPSQIWLHCVEWFDREGRWHRKCCLQIDRILQKEWKTHAATFSSLASAWTSP